MNRRSLASLGLALLAMTGACGRKAAPPTPAAPSAAEILSAADQSFEQERYAAAAEGYETYLRSGGAPERQDRALYRLALSYLLPGEAELRERAFALLNRLVLEFPRGTHRAEAQLILTLHAEVEKLRGDAREQERRLRALAEELDKLKRIDMERRPSRPPPPP